KTRTKVPSPAAEFTQDELRNYPVIVVTHAFYNGRKGHKGQLMKRDGRLWPHDRALVIVDERPEEVTIYETTLAKALDLRDKLVTRRPDVSEKMGRLLMLMTPNGITPINNNRIERPSDHFGQPLVASQLQWFATKEAEDLVKAHANDTEMKG